MQKIKPAEISALLKQQLDSANIHSEFDEIGTVLEVGDGIARVYGLSNAEYGELVSFENGLQGMVLNLEEDHVGVVLFGSSREIQEGQTVKRTKQIEYGEQILFYGEKKFHAKAIAGPTLVNEDLADYFWSHRSIKNSNKEELPWQNIYVIKDVKECLPLVIVLVLLKIDILDRKK